MKKLFIFLTLCLILFSCMKGQKVDLIIHNAAIHCLDDANTTGQAMAILDGRIVEVGPERQILNKYRSDETIDAQGKEVYPGFTDAHGHMLMYAKQLLGVDLRGVRSEQEMIHRCEQYKATHPNLKMLVGRGWDQSLWADQEMPTNTELNQLFPDIPVCLYRIDGHAALINDFLIKKSKMLEKLPSLKGGEVDGGLLIDNAMNLVQPFIPDYPKKDYLKALLQVQDELLQYDVPTSIKSLLDDISKNDGNMTYNQFINLDKRLSAKTREGTGSERAAAYVIRNQLKNITLSPEAAALQPVYEIATGLAKERFDTIKSNPAYRAAINEAADLNELTSTGESLKADKFHDKFVNKGTPESIRRMKAELADDPQALQAMTAGELRIAMRKAGLATDTPDLNPKQLANYIYDNKGRLQEALVPVFGIPTLLESAVISIKSFIPSGPSASCKRPLLSLM